MIDGFFYKHKLVSLILLIWAITVCSWVVWRVFGDSPPDIPGGTATALATVFGLPALAVGVWKWRNNSE